jgi:putative spermidine/putrescine transport system ATP-binding protein
VTHDQQEALAIADRLAIMQAGRSSAWETVRPCIAGPTHPFVTEFLGRVNRIERDEASCAAGQIGWGLLPGLVRRACATASRYWCGRRMSTWARRKSTARR